VTGLAFYSVGQFATNTLGLSQEHMGRALLHGLTGGVLAELQGGSFGHGFVSAGTTKFLSANHSLGDNLASGVAAALIGGTIDELTGGKFASGAATAALQWAFNQQLCSRNVRNRSSAGSGRRRFEVHTTAEAVWAAEGAMLEAQIQRIEPTSGFCWRLQRTEIQSDYE
jgi:hypothetical protein